MTFEELGLNPDIMRAIADCGYTSPTPIQAKAIPQILMARDVVGLAQTGTGKTASFTLPMIEILSGGRAKARMPRSLILSPTRELAAQIAENFDLYGKYGNLTKALLVGGVSMEDQVKKLERGVDVLIATPGRLLDLFGRGNILLSDIKIFVIDEADRMLDMGFIPDIEKIASLIPPIRQTLLFSATMPPEIRKLTQKFLSNPREVSVDPPAQAAKTVKQYVVNTSRNRKRDTLDAIMKKEDVKNAFIFCNRKRDIDDLARWLKGKGYSTAGLHGDMVQSARTKTLEEFKGGKIDLLVCSDVAARGIDIDGVSHVFNFDVPMSADDYVHRIGRTGRAGKEGHAWMLATPEDEKFMMAIEKLTKQKIEVANISGGTAQPASDKAPRESVERPKREHEGRGRNERNDHRDQRDHKGRRDHNDARNNARPHDQERKAASKPREEDDASVTGFGDDMPSFFSHKN